jgi:hypothetical protein
LGAAGAWRLLIPDGLKAGLQASADHKLRNSAALDGCFHNRRVASRAPPPAISPDAALHARPASARGPPPMRAPASVDAIRWNDGRVFKDPGGATGRRVCACCRGYPHEGASPVHAHPFAAYAVAAHAATTPRDPAIEALAARMAARMGGARLSGSAVPGTPATPRSPAPQRQSTSPSAAAAVLPPAQSPATPTVSALHDSLRSEGGGAVQRR